MNKEDAVVLGLIALDLISKKPTPTTTIQQPTPAPQPQPAQPQPQPQPQPMPAYKTMIAFYIYDPQRIFYYQGIKSKIWDIIPTPNWVSINAVTVPDGAHVIIIANPITTGTGDVYTCKQIQVKDIIGKTIASGKDVVTFTAYGGRYDVYARFY